MIGRLLLVCFRTCVQRGRLISAYRLNGRRIGMDKPDGNVDEAPAAFSSRGAQ
ncbi:hypothetical protein IE4771_PB00125 (plasmid) [Rhizobium etli bv. mimosae str. IE4771]|uniref:Uncharacterized protein n=1 Tax=Rhizobium etli bv. mimosae str. IE4771 TaxID=1432050 RepID=A0A060IDQ8_RHIET|nr:hypothetical protein IE4771_PB00125 [Rhizobium sp. IE4771]